MDGIISITWMFVPDLVGELNRYIGRSRLPHRGWSSFLRYVTRYNNDILVHENADIRPSLAAVLFPYLGMPHSKTPTTIIVAKVGSLYQ